MNPRMWFHGLIAAFIGAAAGSVDSGITLMITDPDRFNLGPQLKHSLLVIGILALLAGAKMAAAYLKKAPDPWDASQPDRRQAG